MPTRPPSRPANHTRTRHPHPRTDPTASMPDRMPPRTYTVCGVGVADQEYPSSRFIVTSEGELILIRVSPDGIDQYIAAVYAEGCWHSLHALTRPDAVLHPMPGPLDPDEPPAS